MTPDTPREEPRFTIGRTIETAPNTFYHEFGLDYTDGARVTVEWSEEDKAWIARVTGCAHDSACLADGPTKEAALLALACSMAATLDAVEEDRAKAVSALPPARPAPGASEWERDPLGHAVRLLHGVEVRYLAASKRERPKIAVELQAAKEEVVAVAVQLVIEKEAAKPSPAPARPAEPTPKEVHLLDVYDALGVKWGEDPFAAIQRLRASAPLPSGEPTGEAVAWMVQDERVILGHKGQPQMIVGAERPSFPDYYRLTPLYANPTPPAGGGEEATLDRPDILLDDDAMWSVVNEVFCRVYGDDYEAMREAWRAWYRPEMWFWWGRALGAFMSNHPAGSTTVVPPVVSWAQNLTVSSTSFAPPPIPDPVPSLAAPRLAEVEAMLDEFDDAAQGVASAIAHILPSSVSVEREKRRDAARARLLALLGPAGGAANESVEAFMQGALWRESKTTDGHIQPPMDKDWLRMEARAYYRNHGVPANDDAARWGHRRALVVVDTGVAGSFDWPEDFAHENGRYFNVCCNCGCTFVGHKRRVTCRVCATTPRRDDFDTDVLRALCGEAAQCTAEVDNDAARELTVRLNQAWRGEDPCGVPAHGAGETK